MTPTLSAPTNRPFSPLCCLLRLFLTGDKPKPSYYAAGHPPFRAPLPPLSPPPLAYSVGQYPPPFSKHDTSILFRTRTSIRSGDCFPFHLFLTYFSSLKLDPFFFWRFLFFAPFFFLPLHFPILYSPTMHFGFLARAFFFFFCPFGSPQDISSCPCLPHPPPFLSVRLWYFRRSTSPQKKSFLVKFFLLSLRVSVCNFPSPPFSLVPLHQELSSVLFTKNGALRLTFPPPFDAEGLSLQDPQSLYNAPLLHTCRDLLLTLLFFQPICVFFSFPDVFFLDPPQRDICSPPFSLFFLRDPRVTASPPSYPPRSPAPTFLGDKPEGPSVRNVGS